MATKQLAIANRGMMLLLLLIALSSLAVTKATTSQNHDESTCASSSLYLAPSSLPNNAGLGVFASRNYHVGETIVGNLAAIPVVDFYDNIDNKGNNSPLQLSEYLWQSANLGGFSYANNTKLYIPLLSNINHHSVLDNVLPSAATTMGDNAIFPRISLLATHDIYQGDELLMDYNGAHFIADHPYLASIKLFPDFFGNDVAGSKDGKHKRNNTTTTTTAFSPRSFQGLPLAEDYQQADDIVDGLWKLHQQLLETNDTVVFTPAQWMDVLYRIRQSQELLRIATIADDEEDKEDDVEDRRTQQQNAIAQLLPRTFQELQLAADEESGVAKLEVSRHKITQQQRSICLDTTGHDSSTAPKSYPRGSIVATTPLVVTTQAAMTIDTHTNATSQLLQNYCFGHRQSNLLLCPTTTTLGIRHSKERATVKLQWDQDTISDSTEILTRPLQDYLNGDGMTKRLAFQYVALRDIAQGEELWMDFGDRYQQALESHQERTATIQKSPPPKSIGLSADLPYSYQYECNLYPNMKVQAGQQYRSWEDFTSNRMMHRENWPKQFAQLYENNDYAAWYPCRTVQSQQDGYFDIEVYHKGYQDPEDESKDNEIIRRLHNCPEDRIRIVEAPYQWQPLFDPSSFRHYIPISDDIFPLHWRSDYKPNSYWNIGGIAESSKDFDYEETLRSVDCGLYLAKSNIPNAGFGLFTAVDIPAANIVIGSSLPAIVVHEPTGVEAWYNGWVGKDYVWGGDSFWMMYDGFPDFHVHIVNGLFGAMSNFHTGLVSMEIHTARMRPLLDRRHDPGAGGFSDLVNSAFRSKFPINAGEELFVSYGEHWLEARSAFKDVPLAENFDETDLVAASVWSLLHVDGASIRNETVGPLLRTIQDVLVSEHRTKMALNNVLDMDSLQRLVERNGTAKMTVEARPNIWLEDNGFCLDNFYVKDSTIRQAGNGAFARRSLKKGAIFHSSPVIAASRSHMSLANTTTKAEINPTQLMFNYNFGHVDSSILFMPLTQMIAINHNSDRIKGGKSPNARMAFSRTNDPKTRYLLQRPLQDIYAQKYTAMLIDLVATRDIQPDEEIFIDYGVAWEDAWQKHIQDWQSPCNSTSDDATCVESSKLVEIEMNLDRHNPKYHTWSDFHLSACQSNSSHPWENGEIVYFFASDSTENSGSDDPRIRQEFLGITNKDDGFDYPYLSLLNPRPCKILQSYNTTDTFDVVYFFQSYQIPSSRRIKEIPDAKAVVRFNGLPARDLRFINKPLKGDSHWPGAFRHEIAIPDEEFPKLWRDLQDDR